MKDSTVRKMTFWVAGTMALVLLSLLDLCCGDIPLKEMDGQMARDILLGVRLPRLLTAVMAGAALALSGAQMQAVFRNPLADPHIMGVSAGAGTGAAIATMVLSGTVSFAFGISVAAAAFAGAAAASLLIIAVSARIRSGNTLLLFGVMLGFIFSAVTSLISYSASEESLKMFYSWSAGSFSGNRMADTAVLGILLALGATISAFNAKGLDLILFGEDYSELSGASTSRIRFMSMASCCLVTGAATAFCGPIGFAGIIAPHICRWLTRSSSHKWVIPGSMVCGACLALLADILAVAWPRPVPAGSTMALIGIPVILFILTKKS